jgi:hypothetical protein
MCVAFPEFRGALLEPIGTTLEVILRARREQVYFLPLPEKQPRNK